MVETRVFSDSVPPSSNSIEHSTPATSVLGSSLGSAATTSQRSTFVYHGKTWTFDSGEHCQRSLILALQNLSKWHVILEEAEQLRDQSAYLALKKRNEEEIFRPIEGWLRGSGGRPS